MHTGTGSTLRLLLGSIASAVVLAACSSASSGGGTPSPTLVTVSPALFRGNVTCGTLPGAWRTYVATLTDVTDPQRPFVYPSSPPVPCNMPVSFAHVAVGHAYVAEIQAYDRADLVPSGEASSGSSSMVTRTGEEIAPRWITSCGRAVSVEEIDGGSDGDAGLEDDAGADADAAADAEASTEGSLATVARQSTNVIVGECQPLQEMYGGPEAGIAVDLAKVRASLACGETAGTVGSYRIVPLDTSLSQQLAGCDETVTFDGVAAGLTYQFRIEAFEAGQAIASWAAECSATARADVVVNATCTTLTSRGAIRIDMEEVLKGTPYACGADDVVSYQAVVVGAATQPKRSTCESDVFFSALAAGPYQIVIDGYGAQDEPLLSAFCDANVQPGMTSAPHCQVASAEQTQ